MAKRGCATKRSGMTQRIGTSQRSSTTFDLRLGRVPGIGTLALLSFSTVLAVQVNAAAAARPNILLILADDQTYHDAGCYGNDQVQTPNIDRLASQGMRFTRAFTATAMCAPTRQQLYTGLFPVRNGAYPNHSRVYPGTRSVVHHLRALGYRVGLSGKEHFGPADSFPFEKVPADGLKEFILREGDQPYCLIVASKNPHQPWTEGDPSRYDAEGLKLPPYLVDTPRMRESLRNYYAEITEFDGEVGSCMDLVAQSGEQENTIFLYGSEQGAQFPHCKWTCYDTGLRTALVIRWPGHVAPGRVTDAMVQYVDILPTLIEAAGGHPRKIDTGRVNPGSSRDTAEDRGDAEERDSAEDRASQQRNGFDGLSFLNVLLGKEETHRDHVYGVHTTRGIKFGSASYPVRSIRTKTHKLIWNLNHEDPFQNILTGGRDRGEYWDSWVEKAASDPQAAELVARYQRRGEFELYDLRSDPYELHDLADDPKLGQMREALRTRLQQWMQQQGDQGLDTEARAYERQKNPGKRPTAADARQD
jgi:uncharacterized sulfatase